MKPDPADQAQLDALRPWLVRASHLIHNRLRDARAHAEAGRFDDGASRLDELAIALVEDILHPAREAFYRDSIRTHRLELDPSIVDETFAPTRAMAHTAKHFPILGIDQAADLGRLAAAATDELRLAAYANHYDAIVRAAAHQTWELRHRDRLKSATEMHLSDAQVALHNAVRVLMIRPELR